jgi:hypothetical protein
LSIGATIEIVGVKMPSPLLEAYTATLKTKTKVNNEAMRIAKFAMPILVDSGEMLAQLMRQRIVTVE